MAYYNRDPKRDQNFDSTWYHYDGIWGKMFRWPDYEEEIMSLERTFWGGRFGRVSQKSKNEGLENRGGGGGGGGGMR